ncbi:hypothetical protein POTOM_026517 [Populus tomentosa]|uniref:3-hydroxyisobutyryl-CoA hydrolase n=1 Tax=Populus tomentosa TaxID=118781 RepID=A0A8X7ZJ23_POPTO|nr:hypothetical protein POTOM_026517 [Populus tomentosa]
MMQRLKGLINLKQTRNGFLSYQRNFSALPNYAPNDDPQDQVARLKRLYESWEENPDIGFVLMKVAILDGFTMGSGAGIAVAGMFRVATDKTVSFCSSRGSNKFQPDAGASFYLSCLPGYLREYLAPIGDKLNGVEMIACGLASHYALHERLDLVEEHLGKLITDEATVMETSLAQYGDLVYPDKTSILCKFETFDKCFSHDTVEEIVDALENEKASTYDEWCERAISKKKRSRSTELKSYITTVGPFMIRKVSKDMVDSYFSQLMELEPDLELPTTLQGMLDANDWGHLQTGMVRVLEDTGDLLPFIFALLACSIIAAGAGI